MTIPRSAHDLPDADVESEPSGTRDIVGALQLQLQRTRRDLWKHVRRESSVLFKRHGC